MIKKLTLVLLVCLCICVPGMALAWVVGLYVDCLFVSGCYKTMGWFGLFGVVSLKSILIRGSLLSVVFTFFAWLKIR